MTNPTPAQIEAALAAYNASTKSSYPENAMRAALTAAAEVEQPIGSPTQSQARATEPTQIDAARAMLAAAEVGEQTKPRLRTSHYEAEVEINRLKAELAAAIRALKNTAATNGK